MVDVVTKTDFDAAITALQQQIDALKVQVQALETRILAFETIKTIPQNVKDAIAVLAAYLATAS